jgi:hypothetical protein
MACKQGLARTPTPDDPGIIVAELEQSLKKYPPIALGAPYPRRRAFARSSLIQSMYPNALYISRG